MWSNSSATISFYRLLVSDVCVYVCEREGVGRDVGVRERGREEEVCVCVCERERRVGWGVGVERCVCER